MLSIREASHLLGVSMATLRQWTDEGLIPAFVTPGGHRRYSRENIESFLASHRKPRRIKDIATELEGTLAEHRDLAKSFLEDKGLYELFTPEARQRVMHIGRSAIGLVATAVTSESEVGSSEWQNEMNKVGQELGEVFAAAGIPLNIAIRFMSAQRKLLISNLVASVKAKGMRAQRVVESLPVVISLLDEITIAAVDEYTKCQEKSSAAEAKNKVAK